MKNIELADGVVSSALGFGCAPIMGSMDGSTSRRAIHCALDCGITHFDLARSYGYGEAENFVGKTLAGRRDSLTLASKFGIRANWKANLLKPIKPLVRSAASIRNLGIGTGAPSSKESVVKASRYLDNIPITPGHMRKSLEQSLRALRTDYLDIYMIHDPVTTIFEIDAVTEEAEKLKREGKIRSWGLAFYWDNLLLHLKSLDDFDLLQFNNSPGSPHYAEAHKMRANQPNLIFSPLRGSREAPEQIFSKIWSDFPRSVILCSMFKEAHIRKNAAAASLA